MKNRSAPSLLNPVRQVDVMLFTKYLYVMLKSGIPISEALAILESQTKNPAFKTVLAEVAGGISNGKTLEKSLEKFPKIFNSLYRSIVGIGEESGTLETNLEYLATEEGKAYEFRKKIQGAMLYPILILSTAFIIGSGISLFVLPKLVDLFTSLDVKLPLSTKILMWFSVLMRDHGPLIIGGIVAGIGVFIFIVNQPQIKPRWHKLLLKLPLTGRFIQSVQIAVFCRNLGIMLKSGLPITDALKAAAFACDNLVFKQYIEKLYQAVDKGRSLEAELSSNKYPFIPDMVAKMVGVGEKTGKLDETLMYLGEFFEEESDDMTKNLATILEPILLVIIALMVGFLALSVISPIYQLTGGVHR